MKVRKELTVFLISIFTGVLQADDRADLALVSIADENKVSVFELDKEKRELKRIGELKVNGDAGSQYFDKRRSLLYLGLRNAGKIAVLKLDRKQKRLTLIDKVNVDRDPAYLRVDRTGKWLFAAYYATGRISCFGLNEDGTLKRKKTTSNDKARNAEDNSELHDPQWLTTAPRAHAIVEDSTNRFVYVPHTGPNAVFQFRFNDATGKLKPLSNRKILFKSGTGPRHIVSHPKKNALWFSINEQGSSVTALTMDKMGSLSASMTVSTLPETFRDQNACSDLEITSDGRFLFAANRGHDSIAVFQVSAEGAIKKTGIFATEKTPRQFSLSPDDRFLVSAGQGSNKLALFEVDSESGSLRKLQTIPTGKKPWWVSLVD